MMQPLLRTASGSLDGLLLVKEGGRVYSIKRATTKGKKRGEAS